MHFLKPIYFKNFLNNASQIQLNQLKWWNIEDVPNCRICTTLWTAKKLTETKEWKVSTTARAKDGKG